MINDFASTFENAMSVRLSELYNREVTVEYLHEVRETIARTFLEVLKDTVYATSVTVNAAQWIVNELFKSVKLCEDTTINDLIITNDLDIKEIDSLSLTSLREMFEGTAIGVVLETEHERRMFEG